MGPTGREEIGQASRAYVEQVHDLEQVTDQLVELYETVLEPRRASRAAAVAPQARRRTCHRAPARRHGTRRRRLRRRDPGRGTARGGRVGARQPAPPAWPPLGHLRDRRPRVPRDRGAPAPGLHALPHARRLRPDRDAARADDGHGSDPARGDHERVLPLLLRRGRRRGTSARAAHVVLVHDGRGTLGLVLLLAFAEPVSTVLFGDAGAADLVRAAGSLALGDRQLRAAHRAVPGRGALGGVRLGEPGQRLHHDRADPAARRLARAGRARRDRGQLQRHADRLPRAPRLPARAARAPVRPRPPARDEPLRRASRPDGAVPLGDELQRPLLPRQARRRRRGWSLLGRSADRVGDGAAPDGVPPRVARVRVLDRRRAGGTPDLRLCPHLPHRRHRVGRARADAAVALDRRPPRDTGVRGVVARRRAARVLDGRVRGVHRRRDRHRPRKADAVQLGCHGCGGDRQRRPEPGADPPVRDDRRGDRDRRRLHDDGGGDGLVVAAHLPGAVPVASRGDRCPRGRRPRHSREARRRSEFRSRSR